MNGPAIDVRALAGGDPLAVPSLARDLASTYFVFDAFVAGKRRVDVHPIVLSAALHEGAVRAAEDVAGAIGRIAARAHVDPRERAVHGFAPDTLRLARASHAVGDDALFARVDLLLGDDGRFRACEVNADCPGGHNEALGLPRLARAAGFRGGHDPTIATAALAARLADLAGGRAVALLYATAYAEDLQVCALLQRLLHERGVRAILAPPTAPRANAAGDLVIGGETIGALYRFFPTEWMAGQANVADIEAAVLGGRVRTISSFAHVFAQSKLAFARAWALRDDVDAADRRAIDRHVPLTVDLDDVSEGELAGERRAWVVKRAMGRVGDQVFVGPLWTDAAWGEIVRGAKQARAAGEAWLAQRFVAQTPIATPWGDRFVTLGAYVLDGRFVGYFARVTPESHVSHDALCLPVFVARDRDAAGGR